jgi:hypothetical protein
MQNELFEARKVQEYEQATARKRLEQAAGAAAGAEGRGVLPFMVKGEPNEDQVTGRAGLTLTVEALRAYRADELIRSHLKVKKRDRGYDEVAMVEAFVLLQASGGEHLEDFVVLREDGGLCRLLERELPSPDVAQRFLLHFHDEDLIEAARKAAEAAGERCFVPEEKATLHALGRIQAELARRMADREISTCATLDHDATVIDSQKQTATWHYKGGTGYQPVVVHWAEQDLVLADEFRDGNVPAAKDNLRLIKRAFQSLPDWVSERRFRADSACYDERVLKWLADPKRKGGPAGPIGFTISADMTKELVAVCKRVKERDPELGPNGSQWKLLDDTRAHEIVEWAEVEFTPGVWPKDARPLRYLAMRFAKRQGQLFASGERFKYLAVVTNRKGAGDEIIRWHWKKAGTIEHVHEDTKNGLGAGVLPCGEFGANAAWYRLTMLTYNVLTVIKRQTLPPEQQRIKPKRVRFLVFDLAARLTHHARYLYAHIKQAALARTRCVAARAAFLALCKNPPQLPAG